jgi:hypothetical protein
VPTLWASRPGLLATTVRTAAAPFRIEAGERASKVTVQMDFSGSS